jgi:hypothetical protein
MAELGKYTIPPRKPDEIGDTIKNDPAPYQRPPKQDPAPYRRPPKNTKKDRDPPIKKAQSPDKLPKQQYT